MKIGFIGGGRLTNIFLEGWKRAGLEDLEVLVSEPSMEAQQHLQQRHPSVRFTSSDEVLNQDIIFAALHPPAFKTFLAALQRPPAPTSIFVSLAPVLNFADLAQGLAGHARLIRMIPNAPSMRGKGYNPVAFGPGFPDSERHRVTRLFEALGESPEVHESQLEAYAILCAMGPTYVWPQFQVLRELGTAFGVPAAMVDQGLAAMLHGAVEMLFRGDLSFEEVMDTIPSKPLNEAQAGILEVYRQTLPTLHSRLTGRT